MYPTNVSNIWLQFHIAYNFALTTLYFSHFMYYTSYVYLWCYAIYKESNSQSNKQQKKKDAI